MARPLKEINWDIVISKMEAGCPAKEIWGQDECHVQENAFYRRFKEEFDISFGDYRDRLNSIGDGNIRLKQYLKAMHGSDKMLTLLGVERLGQGKEEVKVSPIQNEIDTGHENMILKSQNLEKDKRIAELEEKLNDNKPQAEQELRGSDTSV
jgi:hypothetical protein